MTTRVDHRKNQEELDTLVGERSRNNKRLRALRIEDIEPLLTLPAVNAQPAAASPPTQAEFDALLNDYKALHAILVDIAGRLKGKL